MVKTTTRDTDDMVKNSHLAVKYSSNITHSSRRHNDCTVMQVKRSHVDGRKLLSRAQLDKLSLIRAHF